MSKLLERCKECVDSEFISWEKTTRLSDKEKRDI